MGDLIDPSAMTASGRTMEEEISGAKVWNDDVIRPRTNPVSTQPALAVLRGNIAPDGCVIKPAAADPALLIHEGPDLVFDGMADLKSRIEDPDLDVSADTVLILRGAGPEGAPGMPEWGMLPPREAVETGRARYGPHLGRANEWIELRQQHPPRGPLALVKIGGLIWLHGAERRLDMVVSETELEAHRANWARPAPRDHRGFEWLFINNVLQADQGCDVTFLEMSFGEAVGEPVIF